MSGTTRAFIIDDHPVVRAGLRELLRSSRAISIVGDAEHGGSPTLDELDRTRPDVIVLDIKLKHESGIDLCRDIKARFPHMGVLLLSAFWDQPLVRQALDARADGYVLKDAEHLDLTKAILSVARGESFFDHSVSAMIAREARGESADSLRLSEQDILILRHVSEGLTNKAIGESMFLSAHTIRDRLSAIMLRIGAKNRAHAAQVAISRGLVPRPEAA